MAQSGIGGASMGEIERSVLVIGGGAAGLNAAAASRAFYPDRKVVLLDAEPEIGYYRPLLSHFIAGRVGEERLFFFPKPADPMLEVRTGTGIRGIDEARRRVYLEGGEELVYDRLVLAPGGRPIVPPVCRTGACRMGVFPVRDLASARAAREWITGNRETMVLGGGLVGVKTAAQLARAGFPVTLIEREPRLLPNLLTRETACPLERHIARIGVRLMLGATVEEIREDRSGALGSVRISGRWVPCRTLLVAIGSRPELGFLRGTALLEGDSLPVGPDLRTRNPRIFAAGDAVTITGGFTPWTWPQAVIQGRLVGENLYRTAPLPLRSLSRVNAQNVSGFALAALGAAPPGAETAAFPAVSPETARELYFKDRRLVGGVLAGDIAGAGTLGAFMNRPESEKEAIMERFLTPDRCFPESIWKAAHGLSRPKEKTG